MGTARDSPPARTPPGGRRWQAPLLLAGLVLGLLAAATSPAHEADDAAAVRAGSVTGHGAGGCPHTPRGIPSCGAYFGGATGANSDPTQLESAMGTVLGVRRTYFSAHQSAKLVDTARRDLARGRLPWVSSKVPYSWEEMADGRGDAWVHSLVDRLDDLDGPVWLAFHHEPEDDAPSVEAWTRMQERLGPIVRQRADNVAFSVIVMGYHQLYGAPRLRFAAMWPDTAVDVSGFDVYNTQGMARGGGIRTEPFDIEAEYLRPLQVWAKRNDTRWALAETGYTDFTAAREPEWIHRTFDDLRRSGGIAMAYFNSRLNSRSDWTLSLESKRRDYQTALAQTCRIAR